MLMIKRSANYLKKLPVYRPSNTGLNITRKRWLFSGCRINKKSLPIKRPEGFSYINDIKPDQVEQVDCFPAPFF